MVIAFHGLDRSCIAMHHLDLWKVFKCVDQIVMIFVTSSIKHINSKIYCEHFDVLNVLFSPEIIYYQLDIDAFSRIIAFQLPPSIIVVDR